MEPSAGILWRGEHASPATEVGAGCEGADRTMTRQLLTVELWQTHLVIWVSWKHNAVAESTNVANQEQDSPFLHKLFMWVCPNPRRHTRCQSMVPLCGDGSMHRSLQHCVKLPPREQSTVFPDGTQRPNLVLPPKPRPPGTFPSANLHHFSKNVCCQHFAGFAKFPMLGTCWTQRPSCLDWAR